MRLDFYPVTPERWEDLERFFSSHGNPNYCWCTFWRLSSTDYRDLKSSERKQVLKSLVNLREPVGILGYFDRQPAAWCSVAPRRSYARLEHSQSIPRIDGRNTWSIACVFLDQALRGRKLTLQVILAAVQYARSQGAQVVEGYPVSPKTDADGKPDFRVSYSFMGFESTYLKAGFRDCTPPGSRRKVMRLELDPDPGEYDQS